MSNPKYIRLKIEEGRTKPAHARVMMRYDGGNPRCGNCKEFITTGHAQSRDSRTKPVHKYCGLGQFNVAAGGCCDLWEGKDGSTLEGKR